MSARFKPISHKSRRGIAISLLAAVASSSAVTSANEINSVSNIEVVEIHPLDNMRIVGPIDQPMLIVPTKVPAWAANLGVTGAERVYKGLCGANGASISVEELFRVAEQDFNRVNRRGTTTEIVGQSPAFAMSYDNIDITFLALYAPVVRSAIEYVDSQLDNRVQIGGSFALGEFDGNTIGSAGSDRFTIPWSVYVEGLRAQAIREDARFANSLPDSSVNVLYDSSTSSTVETSVRVTEAQLRAIFGDNVVPQGEAVSITFNINSNWSFIGCAVPPVSGQQSLIDVVVHELTHSLGFTSEIRDGGNNPNNHIQGLDVARFRVPNIPVSIATFETNPRLGEQFINEIHLYSSFPTGQSTILESGDGNQPSHLSFVSDPDDKLGVMDPIINSGTTRCPNFFSAADLVPLDDMGWRPIGQNVLADCNGNGQPDVIDIALGTSLDIDGDKIPDECESFMTGSGNPGNSNGIVRTIWETPGLTSLTSFNPDSSNVTAVSSSIVSDASESISFPNSNTRVVQYEGFIFAPATDEYAFRVEHPDDMFLLVDDIVIGSSTHAGSIERSNSNTQISNQHFIQLQQGWHKIFVQHLSNSSAYPVRLAWESRGIGSWNDVASGDLQIDNFSDCDGNGTNDFIDINTDLSIVIDLGVVGESDTSIQYDTFGSGFDTEMALWDSSGVLIDQNDDASGTQSAITASLSAGQYTLAITGFNTIFSNGPDYQFINGCSLSGSYALNIAGTQIISGTIPSGRGHIFTFTIGDPDCDMDGIPDFNELDCDMDGVPDDCQLPTIAGANDAGIVGDSNSTFVFNTCGSDFDTEIAVWDEGGTLLGANDDSSCGLQSEITLQLEPGIYYAVIAGYNAFFSNNFGVEMNVDAECSEGGNLQVMLGDLLDDGDFPSGRAIMVRFEIEESASCLAADINGDGTLNFFDISAFLTLFNSLDPQADFNEDGSFNFFDISAFLSVFSMGC